MIDWWDRIAATLTMVAERTGELAERVAEDWSDDHGRERAERLAAVTRSLHEEAAAARSTADRAGDDAPQAFAAGLPGLMLAGRVADRQQGVRLAGVEVERVDDDPGVRLPGS